MEKIESKTNLIITLGTRDLQLNREIQEIETYKSDDDKYYIPKNCRSAGKYLNENFESFQDVIEYPIIKPAINWTIKKNKKIDKLIFICTDQSQNKNVEEGHKNKDTIEIAKVLEKKLRMDYENKGVQAFKKIVITKNVTEYDAMYDFFEENFNGNKNLKFESGDHIILFSQGGIDAINTTLLLKCIEKYPHTIQLHKPESNKNAVPLSFPDKFVKNFNKQKILHDLENFNYAAIANLHYSDIVTEIAQYALARYSIDFEKAQKHLENLYKIDYDHRDYYEQWINSIQSYFNENDNDNLRNRQEEVYLSAKIKLHQKAYADFLMRMFAISENLLKPLVEEYLGGKIKYNSRNNHKEWNQLIDNKPDLKDSLEKYKDNGTPLKYNYPNRRTYKAILEFAGKWEDKNLIFLYNNLEKLANLRNDFAHNLTKINDDDINNALEDTNINEFIEKADAYFNINGFGAFDEINDLLKAML